MQIICTFFCIYGKKILTLQSKLQNSLKTISATHTRLRFEHVTLDDNSAYLLINNCNENKKEYIEDIVRNVILRYPNTIE